MIEILQTALDTSGMQEVMEYTFLGNTVGVYSLSLVFFALLWATIRAFRLVGLRRLRRWASTTSSTFDDQILKWAAEISPFFFAYLSAVIIVNLYLVLPETAELVLDKGFVIVTIYESMRLIQKAINYGLAQTPLKKNKTTLHGIQRIFAVVVWSVGLLMLLSNLGVNVTTLVASLGIGGIAIAFAVQHILGDIFSSFSIFFDKPFAEGDHIVVGDEEGEILQIGLKTTRITALGGEEIVMSNKELTESSIHNYGKLKRRRISFITKIAFDTSLEKLRIVDDVLEAAIKDQKICEFERTGLKDISDWSYDFETVYYVLSDNYIIYTQAQEKINWFLLEHLKKKGINLAIPTSVKIQYQSKA